MNRIVMQSSVKPVPRGMCTATRRERVRPLPSCLSVLSTSGAKRPHAYQRGIVNARASFH